MSSTDCWSQHLALKLIKLYKEKRLLWHPPHLLYYNKEAKQAAWEAIGEEVGYVIRLCNSLVAHPAWRYVATLPNLILKTTHAQTRNKQFCIRIE